MIGVQIDVKLHPEDDDTTAIWAGELPHLPAAGHTVDIRDGEHAGTYVFTGDVHWVLYDQPDKFRIQIGCPIVYAEPWEPT